MTTIPLSAITLSGVDSIGAFATARNSDGEMVGVSLAGEDEVVRDLSELRAGVRVEVGNEMMRVIVVDDGGEE